MKTRSDLEEERSRLASEAREAEAELDKEEERMKNRQYKVGNKEINSIIFVGN